MQPTTSVSRRQTLELLLRVGAGASVAAALSSCRITGPEPIGPGPVVPPPPPGPRYRGELPNVVVVVVDDLAADVMGQGSRFPFLKCPNVERLQREGATFERAFVPTSVCSPSRASLLTGTYAHTHGVRVNDIQDLMDVLPNFPGLLEGAGYDTGFVGKWHMNNGSSEPRLGFDYWLSFAGQGVYTDPTLNENGHKFKASGYVTDLLSDYTVKYIQTPREKPFCLVVSHKAAHTDDTRYVPAPRHENAFEGEAFPEPPSFNDPLAGKPAWQRRYAECGLGRKGWEDCGEVPAALPPRAWNAFDENRLNHLRTLLAVDEGLGTLLQALTNMEQLDNTVVVFTSDNGYMLGAHRLFDKRVMYEESLRVPMVARFPKKLTAGRKSARLVSTLDLAPTFLELAGQAVPDTMLGASLLPLFADEGTPWRDRLLYEYFQEAPGPAVPTMLGVRTERYKYVTYPELTEDIDELYDLEADPYELRNLIADPDYAPLLGELQTTLAQDLADAGYPPQLASL